MQTQCIPNISFIQFNVHGICNSFIEIEREIVESEREREREREKKKRERVSESIKYKP